MRRQWWEEPDALDVSGAPWSSPTSEQVVRMIERTADEYHVGFFTARSYLVARWERFALEAEAAGRSAWRMWARMGVVAMYAKPRIG